MKPTDAISRKRHMHRKRFVDCLMTALLLCAFKAGSSGYGLVSILSVAMLIALASWRFQQPPEKGDSWGCSCGDDSHHHESGIKSNRDE
ncbi:MAG: hypothetical protein H0X66_11140 [Verrucomicrobia bacterium]|nr:hypothetical protein [Verrucomicrobiota bacterium]